MDKSPDAFRTISEVAEFLDTPAHVLRFWESRFPQIKPVKRAGGRRYYRPADVALLSGIRRLLHDDGLTIRGVQKILREQGVRHVAGLTGGLAIEEPEPDAGAELQAAMAETYPADPAVSPASDDAPVETAQILALEGALRRARGAAPADTAQGELSFGPPAAEPAMTGDVQVPHPEDVEPAAAVSALPPPAGAGVPPAADTVAESPADGDIWTLPSAHADTDGASEEPAETAGFGQPPQDAADLHKAGQTAADPVAEEAVPSGDAIAAEASGDPATEDLSLPEPAAVMASIDSLPPVAPGAADAVLTDETVPAASATEARTAEPEPPEEPEPSVSAAENPPPVATPEQPPARLPPLLRALPRDALIGREQPAAALLARLQDLRDRMSAAARG